MNGRKVQEKKHYDKLSKEWLKNTSNNKWDTDVHGLNHFEYSSYKYLYKLLSKICKGKIVLDYGCGNGIHSLSPIKFGAKKVIGIDLSEESLKIARRRAHIKNIPNVKFIKMDCENLRFDDNSFDIILDGGTFSSLDLNKALPELRRVLKKDGILIGIETLGHNPIFNLKRKWNVARGTRTRWAAKHIFKIQDLKLVRKHFNKINIWHFHLLVMFAMPFRKLPFAKTVIKFLDKIDNLLLKIPMLKKYAFKIVFIFSRPNKN